MRNEYANIRQMGIALNAVMEKIATIEAINFIDDEHFTKLYEQYKRRDDLIRVLTDEITRQYDRREDKIGATKRAKLPVTCGIPFAPCEDL